MPKGTKVSRCVEKVKKSGRGVNPYAVCQASTGQSYATGKKLRRKKMNEETLLEGLYNSMCDMAHVIAEAFGLTEATAAARRKAQGQLSPAAAKEAGVMAANVPGGQRAVAQQYRQQGINPDDAKNFAKNRAQSARNARKPGMSPTSQASSQELAQGMRRRTDGNLPTTLKTNDKFVLRASADTYRARKLRGEKNPPKPVILKRTPQ